MRDITKKVRRVYQAILDKERDILNEKSRAVEIASKKAQEEGREEGREEERAKAYLEKIESAKSLLKANISVEVISDSLGLSIEKIRSLK